MLAIALTLHILSAVIWVGGMFAAYMCLRPAAGLLETSQRLGLWRRFFQKFFPGSGPRCCCSQAVTG